MKLLHDVNGRPLNIVILRINNKTGEYASASYSLVYWVHLANWAKSQTIWIWNSYQLKLCTCHFDICKWMDNI